jgi:dephospho-CoA kinase
MKIIGLTGGIGSGKSTAAAVFAKHGAYVVDADRLGHQVLQLPEVKAEIHKTWGDVFDLQGEVDRRKMAAIVFAGNPQSDLELAKLRTLTHPRIADMLNAQITEAEKYGFPLVLIDAPLLLEGDWDQYCSEILFVETPENLRRERVLKRGWTQDEYHARENNQLPLQVKRDAASHVLVNEGDLTFLEKQVQSFLKKIL